MTTDYLGFQHWPWPKIHCAQLLLMPEIVYIHLKANMFCIFYFAFGFDLAPKISHSQTSKTFSLRCVKKIAIIKQTVLYCMLLSEKLKLKHLD